MFKRSKSVRESKRDDIFSDTWGSSTKYKSGTSTRQRAGEPFSPPATTSNARPSPDRPVDLNKPLPPLPAEAQVVSGAREALRAANASQSPNQSRSSPFTRDSAASSWKQRLTLFRRASNKTINEPLPPTPLAEVQPVITSTETFENAPPRKPTYVDAGTQTSPRLTPMRPAEPVQETARRRSSSKHRRPTFSRNASQMSPLAEGSPTRSPKGFWVKMTPSDYFSLPFRPDQAMSPNRSRSPPESSERRTSAGSSKSGSSIGSYESRYSAPEERDVRRSILERPSLARAPKTDSVVEVSSTGSEETITRPGHTSLGQQHSATTGSVPGSRPLPMPFTRLPSFSANRYRRQTSGDNSRSSISPLRHSLKLPESPPESKPGDERPPSPGFFRQPVITPSETEGEVLTFIPDHLKGSPLCPRSPKHRSGGNGFCPMHGRNPSAESDAPPEVERGRRGSRQISERNSDRTSTDGSIDEAFRTLNFGIAKHEANNPDCPATAAMNGICPYHGRWNMYGAKHGREYSEDSVTRVRLRNY